MSTARKRGFLKLSGQRRLKAQEGKKVKNPCVYKKDDSGKLCAPQTMLMEQGYNQKDFIMDGGGDLGKECIRPGMEGDTEGRYRGSGQECNGPPKTTGDPCYYKTGWGSDCPAKMTCGDSRKCEAKKVGGRRKRRRTRKRAKRRIAKKERNNHPAVIAEDKVIIDQAFLNKVVADIKKQRKSKKRRKRTKKKRRKSRKKRRKSRH